MSPSRNLAAPTVLVLCEDVTLSLGLVLLVLFPWDTERVEELGA
jgi:hypothetical protein